jgi:hypothetical protein
VSQRCAVRLLLGYSSRYFNRLHTSSYIWKLARNGSPFVPRWECRLRALWRIDSTRGVVDFRPADSPAPVTDGAA